MGKVKIHELAKELKLENKEILEVAKKLGIKASSHLSSIEESDAKKIKENVKKKPENKKEEIKTTGQVIIRREVIVEEEKKPVHNRDNQKIGIGFDTQRRNKDFNIVYREKPTKPMTVNELFGIKPKKVEEKPKVVKEESAQKVEEKVTVKEEIKKEEPKKEVKPTQEIKEEIKETVKEQKQVSTEISKKPYSQETGFNKNFNNQDRFGKPHQADNGFRPRNFDNNYNKNYNNDFNKNRENGFHKDNRMQKGNFSQNGENRPFNNHAGFNRNNAGTGANGFKKDFRKPGMNNHQQDKGYNDMMSIDMLEKNNQRDYSTKIIDKPIFFIFNFF